MQFILVIVGISHLLERVKSHPQCLDFRPPFRPASSLNFCKEYSAFGCCGAEQDDKIRDTFLNLSTNESTEFLRQCGSFMANLLCQECSPYAAHVYDAEDGTGIKSFPGLCSGYCRRMTENCSAVVQLITSDKNLISLANGGGATKLCSAVKANDLDYCYPRLKRNPDLSLQLGTERFYQKRAWSSDSDCLHLCVKEVARFLYNPVSAKHADDGTHRLFVVEQRGVIWIYRHDFTRIHPPFLDLRKSVAVRILRYDERGLLDIAFHPNYSINGLFYIYYTTRINGRDHVKLSEMKVSNNDMNTANVSTERTILTIVQPAFNHNGGQLLFREGYLYVSTGDGGAGGDPFGRYGNGQNKKVLLGKILRIDINSADAKRKRPYSIPPDNPFVNNPSYLSEIYALGVRNMWRCSVDRGNETGFNKGRMFCGDVGQGRWEEINIIEKGKNYGWRAYEGNECYDWNICNKNFVKNYVPPIHAYSHRVGKSVTGGYVYRGCQYPNMRGKYIFGDYSFGSLFTLKETGNGVWKKQNICMGSNEVCKNNGLTNSYPRNILSFGEDENGELYMLNTARPFPGSDSGAIYQLVDPSRREDPTVCKKEVQKQTILSSGARILRENIKSPFFL